MLESFKDFYRKQKGLSTKPKHVYRFHRVGVGYPVKDRDGHPITREAYSPNQAIRFFKLSYPTFKFVDIEAKENITAEHTPPPYIHKPKDMQNPEQLTLHL